MPAGPTRRRFLAITAAAAGAAALPLPGSAGAGPHVWTGTALGAMASLRLYHPDAKTAHRLIERCRAEIGRLERVFSLYRPDSAVSRLNAAGELVRPPLDLVRLLDEGRRVSLLTGGAFDVTVQPLWRLFAGHFARPGADPAGPPVAAVRAALERVGFRHVQIGPDLVRFVRPGMAVTPNGIAQGYVTDRVAELLQRGGLQNVLVDLGEARALGGHADGRPWRAALADPRGGADLRRLALENRALATTAPAGFVFDAAGRFGHLFDPRSGRPASRYAALSVLAPDATTADALSTGFAQLPVAQIAEIVARRPGLAVHLLRPDGRRQEIGTLPS
jgi:thiamine biosynthesis lipoprotein